MSHTRTAEEIRGDHIRLLGEQLGAVYHELYSEYYWLRLKWQEFVTLFGSAARVDILNASAPAYFHMLQDTLSDDILMHLARLTDSPRSMGKSNLTFMALPELVTEHDPVLQGLIGTAQAECGFARDWRNRRLAHRDLDLALGNAAVALAPATRRSIDRAINSLHGIVNHISTNSFNTQLDPEVIESTGGAEALLYRLRDGIAARQQRLEGLGSGSLDEDDFAPLPPL
jgi:hypothetical protein